jgi:hypothetical protein
MTQPPEPLPADIDALLLGDDPSVPGWRRRLKVPTIGQALADAPTSKHITVMVPNRLAHLMVRRATDLGLTRRQYTRLVIAVDVARAYSEPVEPLLEAVPQRPGYIKPASSAGR